MDGIDSTIAAVKATQTTQHESVFLQLMEYRDSLHDEDECDLLIFIVEMLIMEISSHLADRVRRNAPFTEESVEV